MNSISELKQVEEKLESTQKEMVRYRTMLNNAPVLIWESGVDKLCYYFNQTWLNFTGRTLEQEHGNGWAEGVRTEDLQACLDYYVESFDLRKPFSMQYRLRRHDGEYRWILDNGAPRFLEDGTFLGYIGSCIDITDEKELRLKLLKTSQDLEVANRALKKYSDSLEEQVKERTCHLEEANQALRLLSHKDGLTNINNRRYFDACLSMKWKEYCRNGAFLSCIMVDIDDFKAYNDTYGHLEGDDCLRAIAQALQAGIERGSDILARYGGEEFVFLVSDGRDSAEKLAEKVRLMIESLAIEHSQTKKGIVSISLGVSTMIPQQNVVPTELVDRADKALYTSKNNGRDQVNFKE